MAVLLNCNNEKDPIKNEGAIVPIRFRHSRTASSAVSGGIQPKFELIQAFMVVLATCKNEEDPVKNEGTRVLTTLLTL